MKLIAAGVFLSVLVLSIWGLIQRPGEQAKQDFLSVWNRGPWGKQFMVDFYGLEILVAMWMYTHAATEGHLALATTCMLLMPILGAMPAAIYWLVAVGA